MHTTTTTPVGASTAQQANQTRRRTLRAYEEALRWTRRAYDPLEQRSALFCLRQAILWMQMLPALPARTAAAAKEATEAP